MMMTVIIPIQTTLLYSILIIYYVLQVYLFMCHVPFSFQIEPNTFSNQLSFKLDLRLD